MAKRGSSEARAIAHELIETRGAQYKQDVAAWEIADGVRFVTILGPGNPPITGIAVPEIMRRVSAHLSLIGLPQPGDPFFGPNPLGKSLWDCSSAVSLPPPWLPETAIPDASLRISTGTEVDRAKVSRLVSLILNSESEARAIASNVGDVIDYGRKGTMAPRSSPFVAPAAYYALGRVQDAEDCIAEAQDLLAANQQAADLFSRFVANLREEHRRTER